jgi:hypothetical protein
MPPITPRKLRVILDVRAWAQAHRTQKMGWLRVNDVIEINEEYQGWVRFDPIEGGDDLLPLSDDYNEYWVEPDMADRFEPFDAGPGPAPEPPPGGEISFGEAGAALETLTRYIKQSWNR